MTLSDYRQLMQSLLLFKASEAEIEQPYASSKYIDDEAAAYLNEGYVAGLRQAEFMLEKSKFLTDKE